MCSLINFQPISIINNKASSFYNLLPFLNVSNFESVKELRVENCKLPELYSMLQVKFTNLRFLELRRTSLTKKFFNNETKLEEISLRHAKIEMENLSFFRMPELKKIFLSWSGSSLVLKKDALAYMPQLKIVAIQRCNINLLPETLFTNSTNVQHIDFWYNDITHVPNTLFTNLTKLQTINLNHNKIASIDL